MLPRDIRNKLEPKSVKSMFLGYSTTQKGYKCFDPTNNRLYVSREVKFFEEQGYYEKKDWNDLKDLAASTDRASSLRMLLEHLADSNNNNNQSKAKPDQAPNVSTSEEEELDIGQGEPSMAENEVTQEPVIEEPIDQE